MNDDVWLLPGYAPAELAAADTYDVSAYERIDVRLKSGLEAFVYVAA
jgi:hypothetical protein